MSEGERKPVGLVCPECIVPLGVETTDKEPGRVRRSRKCPLCGLTFSTLETPVDPMLVHRTKIKSKNRA